MAETLVYANYGRIKQLDAESLDDRMEQNIRAEGHKKIADVMTRTISNPARMVDDYLDLCRLSGVQNVDKRLRAYAGLGKA